MAVGSSLVFEAGTTGGVEEVNCEYRVWSSAVGLHCWVRRAHFVASTSSTL